MIGGILIGIGVTALAFLFVLLLRNGNTPSPLSFLVLLVALAVLCIEGVVMNLAIKAKHNLGNTLGLVQETVTAYLPSQGQDYVISADQASAISLALCLIPSVGNNIASSDLSGKTVAESIDTIKLNLEQSMAKQVRKTIWLLVISAILFTALMYLAYGIGGGSKASGRGSSRGGVHGRAPSTRRAPRRAHR